MTFDIQSTITIMGGLGVFAAGIGYAWGQLIQNKSKPAREATQSDMETLGFMRGQIESLQELVRQSKAEARELQSKYLIEIKELNGKLENLSGQLTQKDLQLQEYTKIFQGRDPQILHLLSEQQNYWKQNTENWTHIMGFIEEIRDYIKTTKPQQ